MHAPYYVIAVDQYSGAYHVMRGPFENVRLAENAIESSKLAARKIEPASFAWQWAVACMPDHRKIGHLDRIELTQKVLYS
jgi:hypothetical protein